MKQTLAPPRMHFYKLPTGIDIMHPDKRNGHRTALTMDTKIQEQVDKLREEINHNNYRYHALDDPQITDFEFDRLMISLRELEGRYPELVTPESPTQRVGAPPAQGFAQVEHPLPMLSLANAFNYQELEAWYRRVSNLLGSEGIEVVCELKIDGLAVSLTYQDGRLVQGATRGDGYRGRRRDSQSANCWQHPTCAPWGWAGQVGG